ncbi:hypothetical protein [Williamsia sp. CHRR-6]|uniref:LppU/SCO3897 family protein n=1 Tax=Williamsia sp. CHRR-6 TaxID=2835871 RepID=UPI001BDAC91D|nr:hypothetical protein [Williamsia sp. CHRR-6]MBT0566381.1 hypothetical protein [Williamsia sp. CHRR-6]
MSTPTPPAAPQFPAGASPYGPSPTKKSKRPLFIVLGVVAALVVAIVVVGLVSSGGSVENNIDKAAAGDCLTIGGSSASAKPKKADCEAETFSFIVAKQLDVGQSDCGNDQYSNLTQKGKGSLCLVPNMRVGKCYQFPGTGGSIVDTREVDCGAAVPAEGKQVVSVTDRQDADGAACDQAIALTFDEPAPLTYCLQILDPTN